MFKIDAPGPFYGMFVLADRRQLVAELLPAAPLAPFLPSLLGLGEPQATVVLQPDHSHGNFPKEITKEAPNQGHSQTPKAISSPLMLSSVSRLVSFVDSHRA